ncbi:beta-glucosidase [Sphingomonas sp. KC8]|uniref:beta-glucosidase n=1 Tax=Sphingomonas sp. KC8 TaxID=1030157 RepID=UPI0002489364|nr:beta-glucosidase [Sphingomonas sp. KC8]ARS26123.1 beta-glucosidase [Sphingomonas sp. KC8]
MQRRSTRLLGWAGATMMIGLSASGHGRATGTPPATPDEQAAALVAQMTPEEKLSLVRGSMTMLMRKRPADAVVGAGYVPGIARLGIPPARATDASLGVSNLLNMRKDDVATAMPSALALASTWSLEDAFEAGALIGSEASAKRFNVMLAGGVNLVREPRNGRAFEYFSEDPLLSGIMAGEHIRGVQSNQIVSTVKHFALNDQETGRNVLNVRIGEAEARESDLLAFQIAIERGAPGSVMTAYNRVNGDYASENDWLLNKVLKRDWNYPGWVMSDWGNVHSAAKAANAGLDQQSGAELDKQPFFGEPLKAAIEAGDVSQGRLDDMTRRIVRSLIAQGVYGRPDDPAREIDFASHAIIAEKAAARGMVLLKNEGDILPLGKAVRSILLVGGHADIGVLSGAGSTQVRPVGGPALEVRPTTKGPAAMFARRTYMPSPPLAALRKRLPGADIRFVDGKDLAAAATAARQAEIVIVFVEQWRTEAEDVASLALDDGQDVLIETVAQANPHTIVVLQSGGAVAMPWATKPAAILEAWYPGQRGGDAIASILTGEAAPSGRLPISFPADLSQLPRPDIDGWQEAQASQGKVSYGIASDAKPFDVNYDIEGATVGYKWHALNGTRPLFPFGFGLSYTDFNFTGLNVSGGDTVTASVRVTNVGRRAGVAIPQFYASVRVRGQIVKRLIGWKRLELQPGETATAEIVADRRLLASFDPASNAWQIDIGSVLIQAAADAGDPGLSKNVKLKAQTFRP